MPFQKPDESLSRGASADGHATDGGMGSQITQDNSVMLAQMKKGQGFNQNQPERLRAMFP